MWGMWSYKCFEMSKKNAVNGLLLSLSKNEDLAREAVQAIEQHPRIELGELNECWLPVVVDSMGTGDSHDVHEWIQKLEGVDFVDVVFASVEEPEVITEV